MSKGVAQGPFSADCSVEVALGDPSANNKKYSFENCRISRHEVSGVNLEQIEFPFKIGTIVTLNIRLIHAENSKLKIKASVFRSTTPDGTRLGLSFQPDEFQAELIDKYISQHGNWEMNYLRTSPRITVTKALPLIPVWATVYADESQTGFDHLKSTVLEILDISPFGMLLTSECRNSFSWNAAEFVHIFLEPRGSQSQKIRLYGQIVRITDGISWNSGNQFRTIAIKLVESAHVEPTAFHDFFRLLISETEG